MFELSKEKGFISKYFTGNLKACDNYFYMCELQQWLRDKHNLHIYIDTTPCFDKMLSHKSKYKSSVKVPFQPFKWTTGHYYLGKTYEEALSKGLVEALKLILNENI